MINKLLYRWTKNLPCRVIKSGNKLYLERYYLGGWLGYEWLLHRFVSGDGDRHPHDHPSNGVSFILCGGYIENVVDYLSPYFGWKVSTRKRRFFNKVDANRFHQITHVMPGTWTLFIRGEPVRDDGMKKGWGFLVQGDSNSVVYVKADSAPSEWWRTAGNREYTGHYCG